MHFRMIAILERLNVVRECRALRWRLWQCPPFLYLVMGALTITTMVGARVLSERYSEDFQIIAVAGITAIMLVTGNLIIEGFNRVAEASRMKSEFIAIVSHQLRSPLSIFRWSIDVLKQNDREAQDPDVFERFLSTITDASDNMIQIVNNLLDTTRIEQGRFRLERRRYSLNDLTARSVALYRRYTDSSNITIAFRPDPSLPDIEGDDERIAMIIQNLLDNAVHYTAGPGKVAIATARDHECARWEISDTGIGIPISEQHRIFQKFYRADAAQRLQMHGSGIGLFITHAVVTASGGAIGFRSTPGKGSTFWFTLPLKPQSTPNEPSQ